MSAPYVAVAVVLLAVLVVWFGSRFGRHMSRLTTPGYEPPKPSTESEAARLHDRYVATMDFALEVFRCYEGECQRNVRDSDDEFDRKHFAREARKAREAALVAEFMRDRKAAA